MPEEVRRWIHRHFNVILSFVVGITLESPSLHLRISPPGATLPPKRFDMVFRSHGTRTSTRTWPGFSRERGRRLGHLPGLVADSKAQSVGLEKGDVLNRLFTDPSPRSVEGRKGPGRMPMCSGIPSL